VLEIDLLVSNANEVLTLAGGAGARRGAAMRELGIVPSGSVAIDFGRIVAVGPTAELASRYRPRRTLDAAGCTVLPGFVDPHTHPVFAATREDEFELRLAGADYMAIAAAGGGIHASVRKLRALAQEELNALTIARMARFLELGTTTIEAKSGYGLSTADELKSLRAIEAAARALPLDVAPTFLGAHEIPLEYRSDRRGYLRLLVEEMIPAVASEGLARYCDVFCEQGVFTPEESREILRAGQAHGLASRVHADELARSGGSMIAAEVGAVTADHLVMIEQPEIEALAAAGTIAVLLPATIFHLGKARFAPARALIEGGVPVALATDFNPGTSMTRSMPFVISLALIRLGMSAAEAICAATHNAACALGLDRELGRLEPGLKADLVIADVANHRVLPYHLAEPHAAVVIKDGLVVHQRAGSARWR
jgi:imidazolonepropionase